MNKSFQTTYITASAAKPAIFIRLNFSVYISPWSLVLLANCFNATECVLGGLRCIHYGNGAHFYCSIVILWICKPGDGLTAYVPCFFNPSSNKYPWACQHNDNQFLSQSIFIVVISIIKFTSFITLDVTRSITGIHNVPKEYLPWRWPARFRFDLYYTETSLSVTLLTSGITLARPRIYSGSILIIVRWDAGQVFPLRIQKKTYFSSNLYFSVKGIRENS